MRCRGAARLACSFLPKGYAHLLQPSISQAAERGSQGLRRHLVQKEKQEKEPQQQQHQGQAQAQVSGKWQRGG